MDFTIEFSGHENIRSTHPKTIEITKDSHLTPRGDCIVGINATSACSDLPDSLKAKLKSPKSRIFFSLKVKDYEFTFHAMGHPDLILSHSDDIVIRKSDFICPRTLAIKADKASDLLPREMVSLLQTPTSKGILNIHTD